MQLLVLGTGCAKCTKLYEATEQAVQSLGLQYELEKVTDLKRIMSFGVMTTPALVVDGQVKVSGNVPSVDELKTMLQQTGQVNNQTEPKSYEQTSKIPSGNRFAGRHRCGAGHRPNQPSRHQRRVLRVPRPTRRCSPASSRPTHPRPRRKRNRCPNCSISARASAFRAK